jgi:glycogen operon protein
VTAHDGFTLRDLVSYNEKHNDANGEDNNDGESHNRSWNHGVEGPTDDPKVLGLRARQQRNFLATMLISQGVPMILHGDELGRSQNGNNNTYAQDSELTWIDWSTADRPLLEFTAALIRLRAEHPTFRRGRFFDGRPVVRGSEEPLPDIVWFKADGTEMSPEDWDSGLGRSVGIYLNGNGIRERDERGLPVTDDSFLLYFNADDVDVEFSVPSDEYAALWSVLVDTAGAEADSIPRPAGAMLTVQAKSLVILQEHSAPEPEVDHSVAASLASLAATSAIPIIASTSPHSESTDSATASSTGA